MEGLASETHLVLVLVDHRTVDVPIARTDRRLNLIARCSSSIIPSCLKRAVTYRVLDFVGLRKPGPEANLRNLLAAREFDSLSEGHGAGGGAETRGEKGGRSVLVDSA